MPYHYQCRRFHAGRAIEHSGADEALQTSDAEAAVGHTCGKDYCLSGGLASVVEREDVMVRTRRKPNRPVGEHTLGAEQHRLLPCPVCQLATVQATWESQIVRISELVPA